MFGQRSSSLFGGSTSNGFGAKLAGTTGFGGFGAASTVVGTTQKFEPVIGTDQVTKNGMNQSTNTKLMVITAMKVYENKTLEELRVEDYLANRKTGGFCSGGATTTIGAKPTGSFGGGFGQAPTASPFEAQQQQQQTGGVIFGQTTSAKTGALLGTSTPTGSRLLGQMATTSTGGSLSEATKPGGFFGTTTAAPSFGGTTTVTQAATAAQSIVLGSDVNPYKMQKAFLDAVISNNPYGDIPLLRGTLTGAGSESNEKETAERLMMHRRQEKFLASKRVNMPSVVYGSPQTRLKKLPPIGTDLNTSRARDTSARSASTTVKSVFTPVSKKVNSPLLSMNKSLNNTSVKTLDPAIFSTKKNSNKKAAVEARISLSEVLYEDERHEDSIESTANCLESTTPITAVQLRSQSPHPARISLTLKDYYTKPSLEEMALLTSPYGVCHLEDGLTIGRLGYGSIFWAGPLSLSDVVIDEVVIIRSQEVIVYPNDAQKPPVGVQLNRPAEISLERVWPRDKSTNELVKDGQMLREIGFHERLERNCKKMGTCFKDYRPCTGTWVFSVPHFSRFDDCSITKVEAHSVTSNRTVCLNLGESQLEAKRERFDSNCKPFEEGDNSSEQHKEINAMSSEEEVVLEFRLPKYSFAATSERSASTTT
uniref:Nuclear pore complex protein Nup98-Nup96 n=1 Tax=Steinernema glaseri TaxID=37863 RepID=A0A1I7YMP4_9BILA